MIDDTALLWLSKLGSPNTWMTDLDTKTNVFARIDKKKNDKMSYARKANRRGKKTKFEWITNELIWIHCWEKKNSDPPWMLPSTT